MMSNFQEVWIVLEAVDDSAINRIWRVFDNEEAANDYVNDPKKTGKLVVKKETVEGGWPFHDSQ